MLAREYSVDSYKETNMDNFVFLTEMGETYGLNRHLKLAKKECSFILKRPGDYSSIFSNEEDKFSYNWRTFRKDGEFYYISSDGYEGLAELLVRDGKSVLGRGKVLDTISEILKPQVDAKVYKKDFFHIKVGRFYSENKPNTPFIIMMPLDRLMERNKGPLAAMGEVSWFGISNSFSSLFESLEKYLSTGYTAFFGLDLLITQDEIIPLEVLNKIPTAALYSLKELVTQSWGTLLPALGNGGVKSFRDNTPAISLLLTSPPFPYSIPKAFDLEFSEAAGKHIYKTPYGYYVTSRGDDIHEARKRVYRTINNLELNPEIMYRADVGAAYEETYQTLYNWGYIDAT